MCDAWAAVVELVEAVVARQRCKRVCEDANCQRVTFLKGRKHETIWQVVLSILSVPEL
jgi:hypothetical protein